MFFAFISLLVWRRRRRRKMVDRSLQPPLNPVQSSGRDNAEIDGREMVEVGGREKVEIDGTERLEMSGKETVKTAQCYQVAVLLDDFSEPTELDSTPIETQTTSAK
jgi:hypothetical protein